jgi:tryptophanyl-tRNA synthetase
MSIVTDSTPVEAPKNPAASSIFQLYALVASPDEIAEMREAFAKGGRGYGDFKQQLFGRLWEFFAPMRQRRDEILAQPGYIDEVLAHGAERANAIANEVMTRVRRAVGIR